MNGLGPGERVSIGALRGSSAAYCLALLFAASRRHIFAVAPDVDRAEALVFDLRFFLPEAAVSSLPWTEILPFELQSPHPEISSARLRALNGLIDAAPVITVAPVQNLLQRVMPKRSIAANTVTLSVGAECPMERLVESLGLAGYSRMSMVEERGEMSLRGGILDVFAPGFDDPLRVEFFGDEVESIRSFDIATQRSKANLARARILPARETIFAEEGRQEARTRLIERSDELGLGREVWEPLSARLRDAKVVSGMDALLPVLHERLDTVFDYIPGNAITAVMDPEAAISALRGFEKEAAEAAARASAKKQFFVRPETLYMGAEEALGRLNAFAAAGIETMRNAAMDPGVETNADIRADISLKRGGEFLLKPLVDRIRGWIDEGRRVYLTAHNKGQAERTRELLAGYGLNVPSAFGKGGDIVSASGPGPGFGIVIGGLCGGFRLVNESLAIISEEDVFGERVRRRAASTRRLDAFLAELQDLVPGDYIVHRLHGIGAYRGLKRLSVENVEGDFLLLEYRDGDKLYLPVWRLDLVSKYHGVEGSAPALDKLGGTGWAKTKKRVKRAVEKLAGELLKLYAERSAAKGYAFSKPDHVFAEFEAAFEYEETPDQARAIAETLSDMTDERPMDRLVCGDVGFGKTEVAMRAAFKAALDGKQTAVLVPTTVLAQQHYDTFSKRLAPYPARVESLSRFRSKAEQKAVLDGLAGGTVDIVIGTHRLLQKDVAFKDLGLIVIDEEHRFGVAHKERMKRLKKEIDCLTLTATPIPRTLQMSLASIRGLSIINTPPEDRLAIKTYVIGFDEAAIAEAIERELARGGQVFFVHNRVQSIGAMEEFIRRVCPGARVAVAHGQMKEGELEARMLGFIRKDYDVLLSTTIIESGLDIPSANTIIINRADRFGLAELYQLRGRVGRSAHRAYAYLVCPASTDITADAAKRIDVIRELAEPGSGFKIAAYDLEIRGAGELLGASQSGQLAEVGFETYAELLEEAVAELRGEEPPERIEPDVNIKVSQYIPEEYVPDARQRLSVYKRLASVETPEELDAIAEELGDRFGEPPALVGNLLRTAELKTLLRRLRARDLTQRGQNLYVTFAGLGSSALWEKVSGKALKLVKAEPRRFRLTPAGQFVAVMAKDADPLVEARYLLKELEAGCYS
ncbi:MAG: transcription-repair coupling factor [Deltaproteobacteria bacterium]|nr:transcription-repair coupling factor [Deltaproteobacteria bacterium]